MDPKTLYFRDTALASELVTEDQIHQALDAIVGSKSKKRVSVDSISDKQLAAQLVEMGVLSAYQADQMLRGKTRLYLGPYVITDWIGQGGMGQVFKAVHGMLGRECAIKVLPLHKSTPEAIESFRREIRVQAKMHHPNLVHAYDAGKDGNVHYLVVEYVPGTDLRRLVRTKGKLDVQQAANIVKQAAEALDHAHRNGLIHRDVKPGNILVTPTGDTKLSDLGLAYFFEEAESDPRAGKVVGTADYLSPEQIRTPGQITHVSDIYSLGCTLYYAVTGKVPFPGGTPKSKARRHLEETPWHPRRFNEEVSDDFVDLIGDMMEKDPKGRIQSAAEIAERLAPWAEDSFPLLGEDLQKSPRWASAPIPSSETQDTDPNNDEITEMAMNEGSDNSQISAMGSTADILSAGANKPPPPLSTVARYSAAGRLVDEPQFPMSALFITGAVCLAVGILAGFIGGYLLGS